MEGSLKDAEDFKTFNDIISHFVFNNNYSQPFDASHYFGAYALGELSEKGIRLKSKADSFFYFAKRFKI